MSNGEECYRRFLDGDKAAFDEIVELYRDNLIFFINGFVHSIHDAEDLAADTFLELIVHKHRYNFKYSLKGYIYMVARCRALNFLKRGKRMTGVDTDDLESLMADESELSEEIITDERNAQLYAAMGRLSVD